MPNAPAAGDAARAGRLVESPPPKPGTGTNGPESRRSQLGPASFGATRPAREADTVTLLAANCSDSLLELLDKDEGLVDMIKVSAFDDPELWPICQAARRRKPLILHGLAQDVHPGNPGFRETFDPSLFRRALEATDSTHVSVHLQHRLVSGWSAPDAFLEALVADVALIRGCAGLPVHLENIHSYRPVPGKPWNPDFVSSPEFIGAALARTGCRFLLDLGHARITAGRRGEPIEDYLSSLPLEDVREVHLSGPVMVDGELRDRHYEVGEEGYAALRFILERAPVELVTLEYGGVDRTVLAERADRVPLERQLHRLREMLPADA